MRMTPRVKALLDSALPPKPKPIPMPAWKVIVGTAFLEVWQGVKTVEQIEPPIVARIVQQAIAEAHEETPVDPEYDMGYGMLGAMCLAKDDPDLADFREEYSEMVYGE